MRPSRLMANAVGAMLLLQVVLGGSSALLNFPITYHLIWGILTFIVLVVTTVLVARDYSVKSILFKVAVASIAVFVVQGILGLFSFGSDAAVLVHLTNAFIVVIVTYLISFADRATAIHPPPTQAPGTGTGATAQ